MKTVGKCYYCNDPILGFQKKVVTKGKRYHQGCYKIKESENIIIK